MVCKSKKPSKHGKVQNNQFFLWRKTLVFLPKRPKNRPFLLSVRFLKLAQAGLGVDGV
jgi:hypothetical protein